MSIDDKRRYAAAGFVALLVLSVFWPSPIVSTNRLLDNRTLAVDELSFLGREAPSWDVLFWCIAGLFALLIIQTGTWDGSALRQVREMRFSGPRFLLPAIAAGIALIAILWIFADQPMLAWAERIRSETIQDFIRIVNRFGGGMNPPMIIIFFLLAGLAYQSPRWVSYAVAMAIAGASAGITAHALKFVVGRTRPELWLGAFHYARGGANSFPSGHTVGAFALAGVLVFASRSLPLRAIALLLACAVGSARILAFRHWTSDVVASALIGLLCAWVVMRSIESPSPRVSGERVAEGRVRGRAEIPSSALRAPSPRAAGRRT
jgi:membrane-associated phospholipid phosphatase